MIQGIFSSYANWLEFNTQSKLLGVLAVALLFLWLEGGHKRHGGFFWFTCLSFVLCLFPPTAYVLQLYQSLIYHGAWIYTFIPVIPMIGYAAVTFILEYIGDRQRKRSEKWVVVAAVLIILGLSLGTKKETFVEENHNQQMKLATQVLDATLELAGKSGLEHIVLWAPEEILQYARIVKPEVALYYGRDMWEKELEYFTDDRYSTECRQDYEWMKNNGDIHAVRQESDYQGARRIHNALKGGVNCLILPSQSDERIIRSIEIRFFKKAVLMGEYYIFIFTEDEVNRLA